MVDELWTWICQDCAKTLRWITCASRSPAPHICKGAQHLPRTSPWHMTGGVPWFRESRFAGSSGGSIVAIVMVLLFQLLPMTIVSRCASWCLKHAHVRCPIFSSQASNLFVDDVQQFLVEEARTLQKVNQPHITRYALVNHFLTCKLRYCCQRVHEF